MASTRPVWASEVTSRTPPRPRATRSASSPFQAAEPLGGGYPQAQDLPVSVGVDPGSGQDHRADHATAFADLHCQGVGRHEDEGAGVAQGTVAEGGDVLVELGRHT